MCKMEPEELLDLIEKTKDIKQLRWLLKDICDCGNCSCKEGCDTAAQGHGRCLQHRMEFRNWLLYSVEDMGS